MDESKLRYKGSRWGMVYGAYTGVEGFAVREVNAAAQRLLPYVIRCEPAADHSSRKQQDLILVGTPSSNPLIAELVDRRLVEVPRRPQAYTIACLDSPWAPGNRLLVVAGADAPGVLHGAVDLNARVAAPAATAQPADSETRRQAFDSMGLFSTSDYPRIANRGIWTWGYVVYDYRRFMDNMARLKMNMLTIWNDCPPVNIAEVISHAHSRGVKIVLGFHWGWGQDWDLGSSADRRRIKEMVLQEYETSYRTLQHDGIYFQTLTEHREVEIDGRSVAGIVCEMVNDIAGALLRDSPDLAIQFGLHATSIRGRYADLANLDPRVTIVWEDAGALPFSYAPDASNPKEPEGFRTFEQTLDYSTTLARFRPGAEFAMVPKGWTNLDWENEFEHHGPFLSGERHPRFIARRLGDRQPHWDGVNAAWRRNCGLAARFYREILKCRPASMTVTGLIEDGLFEEFVQPSVALFAETLWNPDRDMGEIERTAAQLGAAANEWVS